MNYSLVFLSLLAVANCQTGSIPWPKPNDLVGLWPLNNYYRFRDITGKLNGPTGEGSGNGKVDSNPGPFGDPYQSMKPGNGGIFSIRDAASVEKLQLINSSITISFFLRHRGLTNDGLLQFHTVNESRSRNAFSLDFIASILTDKDFKISTSNGEQIDVELINDNEWQFIAVRFNADKGRMSIAGRHGIIYKGIIPKEMYASLAMSNDGFTLGKTYSGGTLNDYSSVSCFSIYKAILNDEELYQLQDSCRLLHSSSPCGATRLPMTAVPVNTTTVARQGQFPWISSVVKGGSLYCVGSILDPRHVLTTASCLGSINSSNMKTYKVIVGDYDYTMTDSFQQSISIANYHIHPDYNSNTLQNNVAILELADVIDMSSPYVNDVCLPSYNVNDDFLNSSNSMLTYVAGWGYGGRNEFVSNTTLRYVTGYAQPLVCNNTGNTTSYGFDSAFDAPGMGDEGAGLLLPVGTDGLQAAPRFIQRGIYNGNTCNKPRFESVQHHWPWIKQTIACYIPGGKTLSPCPQDKS